MENASKALIIAATSLIALMVLAAMVYLFRQGSKMSENYDRAQIQRNLELYNSRFLNYNNDRNTLSDIISLCNLAYNTNVDADYDEGWCVQINVNVFGSYFVIPSTKPADSTYSRNMIFKGSSVNNAKEMISIYELTAKSIHDLAGDSYKSKLATLGKDLMSDTDALNRIKLNEKIKYQTEGHIGESEPVFEDYLFFFECDQSSKKEIKVNSSGRVCEMNFNVGVNQEIGQIIDFK